jgi:hypothetical protein
MNKEDLKEVYDYINTNRLSYFEKEVLEKFIRNAEYTTRILKEDLLYHIQNPQFVFPDYDSRQWLFRHYALSILMFCEAIFEDSKDVLLTISQMIRKQKKSRSEDVLLWDNFTRLAISKTLEKLYNYLIEEQNNAKIRTVKR